MGPSLQLRGTQIYLKLEFNWAKHIFPLYDHIEDTTKKIMSNNDVLQFPPDMSIFTQKAKFVFFGMFQLDLQYCTTKTQPEPQLPLTPPLTQTYPPLTLAIWFGVTYYALSLSLFHLLQVSHLL